MSTDNTNFPRKHMKQLPTGWSDVADSMKDEELKKTIFECEANIYTIQKAKEEDHKLNGAREMVKELSGPYSDAKKVQQSKIAYALFVLEQRGVDLDKGGH